MFEKKKDKEIPPGKKGKMGHDPQKIVATPGRGCRREEGTAKPPYFQRRNCKKIQSLVFTFSPRGEGFSGRNGKKGPFASKGSRKKKKKPDRTSGRAERRSTP